eukprot:TRINITY_DN19415_c0_g1_i2.p1 TRINITY_DN19415_c0_g1~~TRINITY_DN19415_c0_g1_i2.p1  ORF type:complete len:500 (-),score=48.29 TRINITY_DN19415_c0_g1_i2:158-1657(-)
MAPWCSKAAHCCWWFQILLLTLTLALGALQGTPAVIITEPDGVIGASQSAIAEHEGALASPSHKAPPTEATYLGGGLHGSTFRSLLQGHQQQETTLQNEPSSRPNRFFSPDVDAMFAAQGVFSWRPAPDRFLYLFCEFGRVSNRVRCFTHAATIAGLLNRTLLVNTNSSQVTLHYQRDIMFDLEHFRSCLGNDTIMTFHEYRKKYGIDPVVDEVLCFPPFSVCPDTPEGRKGLTEHGTHPPELGSQWSQTRSIKRAPFEKVEISWLHSFDRNATGRVLFVGEMYHMDVRGDREHRRLYNGGQEAFAGGDVPFLRGKSCPRGLVLQPHPTIFRAAEAFVEEVLGGGPFMAVHLRRGDVIGRVGAKLLYEVVACYQKHAVENGLNTMFLATDATPTAVEYITETFPLCNKDGQQMRIVRLHLPPDTAPLSAKTSTPPRWVEILQKEGTWKGDKLPIIMIDKVISAMGTAFIGSEQSTFTADILRLRYGLGTASARDRFVCE